VTDTISYWTGENDEQDRPPVGVLIQLGGGLDEESESLDRRELLTELSTLADGAPVRAADIDPYVGAGGYGLAFLWDVVSKGADVITWVIAAQAAAPQIRRIADAAGKRFAAFGHGAPVCFTPSAIEALYLADLATREPDEVDAIQSIRVERVGPSPAEPREELLHLYSAYAITVTSSSGGLFGVRLALVNSQATLIGETVTTVPMPNGSHWGDRRVGGRPLYSGPWQTR